MASDRTKAIRPPAQTGTADGGERIAIFFGAGASKAFGYPLVGELLPCLRDAAFHSMPSHWDYSREDHETLRAGLKSVYPQVDTCPAEQLPPITDLLSLIDHADRSGSSLFSGWPRHQVDRFRVLVENAIGEMVGPDIAQTDDQRRCAEKVARAITGAADRVQLGIVTTNYDIEIDRALFRHYGELNVANAIDFGMSWRDPNPEEARIYPRPQKPRVSLLKLHGSLNWLRCPLCEYIYINVYGVIVGWATEDTPSDNSKCHCNHWPLQSTLVTPSFVRDLREVNLMGIWRNSLETLASSDRWVVIGYSLPPEDLAIRSLLIKAHRIRQQSEATGRAPLKIWVVQQGEKARDRYNILFPKMEYHADGLEKFDFESALNPAM